MFSQKPDPYSAPERPTLPQETVRAGSEQFLVNAKIRRLGHQIGGFSQFEGYLKATGVDPQTWLSAKVEERSSLLKQEPSGLFRPADRISAGDSGLQVPHALARIVASNDLFGAGPWLRLPFVPWSEGINEFPVQAAGSIETRGRYPGPQWRGKLSPKGGGPEDWWIHAWHTVIAFPPPSAPSLLAYRFTQTLDTFLFHAHEGSIYHFIGVSEVPMLSSDLVSYGGSESWPLVLNFADEDSHYARYLASSDIQGEFGVRENRVPALAMIAGTVVGLEYGSLEVAWGSSTPMLRPPMQAPGLGFLEYRYISEPILAPLLRAWNPPTEDGHA